MSYSHNKKKSFDSKMHLKNECNGLSRISDESDCSVALSTCSVSSRLWKPSLRVLFCSDCNFSCWWFLSSFFNASWASSWALITSACMIWSCFTSIMNACTVIWWGADTSLTFPPVISGNKRVTVFIHLTGDTQVIVVFMSLPIHSIGYRKGKYS